MLNKFVLFLEVLLGSPAFYTAAVALAHAVLFNVYPDFPKDVVTALDGLIVVIAAVITGQTVVKNYQIKVKNPT